MNKVERNLYQAYIYRVNALKRRGQEPPEDFQTFMKFNQAVSQATSQSLTDKVSRQ